MSTKSVAEHVLETLRDHHDAAAAAHKSAIAGHEPGTIEHAFHKVMHEQHATTRDKLAECNKAVTDEMAKRASNSNALEPSQISMVTPNNPNIRAVPRNGQPALVSSAIPKVDVQFEKIFAIEDAEPIF
jgi:hypothetical protein